MTSVPYTVGVILAGGLSRRMGGGDKSLTELGGKTLLARVIGVLQPQCVALVLNANGDPARFASYGMPVAADSVPDFAGPLAGVLAGLDWAAEHRPGVEWVLSAASDTPFLPTDLVSRLHDAREKTSAPIAVASSGGRTHPVNALWSVSLRDDLRRALMEEGLRKVEAFTTRHGAAQAAWKEGPPDPFFNVNTPEDVETAARHLRG